MISSAMRFSINTVLFVSPFTNKDTRLFRQFKKWGFDAVELLIEDPAHIDPVFVRHELDRHHLACGSVAAPSIPGAICAGVPPANDMASTTSAH
jgi:D-psicose/D-tagatose/L-ribulose 3-epimerase